MTGQVLFEGQSGRLDFVNLSGGLIRSITIGTGQHGDIAMTPNGSLYAVGLQNSTLSQYDPASGALIRAVPIIGATGQLNGLSTIDDSTLVYGTFRDRLVRTVNVDTGVITVLPNLFPEGYYSSGDFFALGGGDLLAIGANAPVGSSGGSALFVLHADGTSTMYGTLPQTWGAARIGQSLYLGLSDGTSVKVPDYSALPAGSDPIATEPFYTFGPSIWGATATSETAYCPVVDPADNTGDQGAPVTVSPQYRIAMDPAQAEFATTGQPPGSTLSADGKTLTVPGEGVWRMQPDGSAIFTPDPALVGNPTPVRYSTNDLDGTSAVPALLSVFYPDVSDVSGVGTVGQPVTVPADLGEGVDPTSVFFPADGQPAGAVVSADGQTVTVPGEGVWTVNPDSGALTFTPETGFTGIPTDVLYSAALTDDPNATATPAKAHVAYPDVVDVSGSGPQGDPVSVPSKLGNDMDPSTVQLIDPATGRPTSDPVVIPGEGTWSVDPNTGAITFTPVAGFQGNPTPVTYTAKDVEGNQADPATVTITYPDVPDVTGSGPAGDPVTVKPELPEGVDPGTMQLIDPDTGQPTTDPIIVPGEGTWTVDPGRGTITFTPEEGFEGDPTPITYIGRDSDGNPSLPGTVTITYPDAPTTPVPTTPAPSAPMPTTPVPGNPSGVGIDTGAPELAQGPNTGLIAAGGALMVAAVGALGFLLRRRRTNS